jgi:hypothetical protein
VNTPGKIKRAMHVTNMEDNRRAYRILIEKGKRRIRLGRLRRRWEDNIKQDIKNNNGG